MDDNRREIRVAVALARASIDSIEEEALASVEHATRAHVTNIDASRAILEDAVSRVRRMVLRAYERDTRSESES